MAKTNPDPRIDTEIRSRSVDCEHSALVCTNKGIKKGTNAFDVCKAQETQLASTRKIISGSTQTYQTTYTPRVSQQACEQITTWLERMECFENRLSNNRQANEATFGREVLAYMRVLIENVKSGKMSEAEAKYAYEQKLSEIRQRLAERKALESLSRSTNQMQNSQVFQQTPTYQGTVKTECRPAQGLEGGFDCTTGPDARDVLLQKLANP